MGGSSSSQRRKRLGFVLPTAGSFFSCCGNRRLNAFTTCSVISPPNPLPKSNHLLPNTSHFSNLLFLFTFKMKTLHNSNLRNNRRLASITRIFAHQLRQQKTRNTGSQLIH